MWKNKMAAIWLRPLWETVAEAGRVQVWDLITLLFFNIEV